MQVYQDKYCSICWREIFATRLLERAQASKVRASADSQADRDDEPSASYSTSIADLRANANQGCEWCTYLLQLLAESHQTKPVRRALVICVVPIRFDHRHDEGSLGVEIRDAKLAKSADEHCSDETLPAWQRLQIRSKSVLASTFLILRSNEFTLTSSNAQGDRQDLLPLVGAACRSWLKLCTQQPACLEASPKSMPTRVLDIADLDSVRLVDSDLSLQPYVALSYCWGGRQDGVLLKANVENYHQNIALSTLSATVREAILITQAIGIRYLWVDALCIIQDSIEDKLKEITSMAAIYRDTLLTLSIAGSDSAQKGFLNNRVLPRPVAVFPYLRTEHDLVGIEAYPNTMTISPQQPLDQRAWTYQESMLSTRRLSFETDQIRWHCRNHAREAEPVLSASRMLGRWISNGLVQDDRLVYYWTEAVSEYSGRALTNSDDKLLAFSAVARTLCNNSKIAYLAGLLDRQVVEQLMWSAFQATRPRTYRAPSWSWAAVDGLVDFWAFNWMRSGDESAKYDVDAELISHEMQPVRTDDPFGQIERARLTLHARCIHISDYSKDRHLLKIKLDVETAENMRSALGLILLLRDKSFCGLCLLPSSRSSWRRVGTVTGSQFVLEAAKWQYVNIE